MESLKISPPRELLKNTEQLTKNLSTFLLTIIRKKAVSIPVMPHIAQKVVSATSTDTLNYTEITSTIKNDQLISSTLLQLARSPFYRSSFPVNTVEDALRRIGLAQTRRLLVLFSLYQIDIQKGRFSHLFIDLWKHSMATAMAAEHISTLIHINTDKAYLASLLHDIGNLVLMLLIIDIESNLDEQIPLDEMVLRQLMMDLHVEAGLLTAKTWHLPDYIAHAIGNHHHYDKDFSSNIYSFVTLCSDRISASLGYGFDEPEVDLLNDGTLLMLNITPSDIENMIKTLEKEYSSFFEHLGI